MEFRYIDRRHPYFRVYVMIPIEAGRIKVVREKPDGSGCKYLTTKNTLESAKSFAGVTEEDRIYAER